MGTEGIVAVRTRYQAGPGRRVIVVTDLDSLQGPVHGIVELPLRLFWSSPDRTFDLDQPTMREWLYQTVLIPGPASANAPYDAHAGLLMRNR